MIARDVLCFCEGATVVVSQVREEVVGILFLTFIYRVVWPHYLVGGLRLCVLLWVFLVLT